MITLHALANHDHAALPGDALRANGPLRCRGIAPAALLPIPRADRHAGLTAGTSVDNPGSQHVQEKNRVVRTGTRDDAEAGALILRALDLTDNKRAA